MHPVSPCTPKLCTPPVSLSSSSLLPPGFAPAGIWPSSHARTSPCGPGLRSGRRGPSSCLHFPSSWTPGTPPGTIEKSLQTTSGLRTASTIEM
uniref:Uncharacterized protein n=1 Tax=Engystomops pustulosus TaxID=76066 RepID=A0AAV6YSU4_ENGPU|nr:hypothetical protein GDO81_025597 [Engystomops pustulosus]